MKTPLALATLATGLLFTLASAGSLSAQTPMPTPSSPAVGTTTVLRPDSLCQTTAKDSITYAQADSSSRRKDAMTGKTHSPSPRINCLKPNGLGTGVGTDSSMWPKVRPDTSMPRKP
jgi:hypothetical protein